MKRRYFLGAMMAAITTGCSKLAETKPVAALLESSDDWHKAAHRLIGGRYSLAREFPPEDISPFFRGNGTIQPDSPKYLAHLANGFADWRLQVGGLVERPLSLSLAELHSLPQRTQITRHDCVEGWSAIGQWTGPQLGGILALAGLQDRARYVVFRCADRLGGDEYYESVDLIDAFHPQTIVAHSLNGHPLPVRNGAPLRMRIERQLGYKHAKYLTGIEAVESLDWIEGGNGGYWEDRGYHWYAGI
ncbi:molybdopterin-dependent oxidoreductase [Altericroceibacterium xinjiangense]|uniref:molybdopterin-dependent oxidoreductase n=1 Tax=Altericroceibacterium xinjiangense TaxID=762261 RepID=UPI000F7EB1FA|nr:molybdopterin-dependent oxidoreductase [Altericroceibacterium xinjiangense]